MPQVGLYVHIPFCKAKCAYCDFYSLPAAYDGLMDAYLKALILQLREYAKQKLTADTIYIGGGTPSIFGAKRLAALLKEISKSFQIARGAEVTVEVNPESVGEELFRTLQKSGVNRISMGVQSSDDAQLARLGRLHDFNTASEAVILCRNYCTDNISLDLMYGLPGQDMQSWMRSVDDIVRLSPRHISCYALTLEENTPLYKNRPQLPDDDLVADMYLAAVGRLEKLGYGQYEISNFAQSGFESKHNLKYWEIKPYIGIGCAAHSFFGGRRFSAISDARQYIENMQSGDAVLSDYDEEPYQNRSGEYIMLKLRTAAGIDENVFSSTFGCSFAPYANRLQKYINVGDAVYENGVYRLTPKGFFISNTILSDILDVI